jgi:hypothetical protein
MYLAVGIMLVAARRMKGYVAVGRPEVSVEPALAGLCM